MSSSKDLNFELLKELECPVCLEYMTSSIKMCENGHSVCNSCNSSVSVCPTCRGKLINVRNINLEKVAAAATYPCKNREAGCTLTLTTGERDGHQNECLYRSRECAFKILWGVNCPWTGIPSSIMDHVSSEHECDFTRYVQHDPHVLKRYKSVFEVTLQNVSPEKKYGKAMFAPDGLFYLDWEITADTFYFAVFYAGHEDKSTRYKYKFEICHYAQKSVTSGVCHSYLRDKGEVLNPGQCVIIHYDALQKYLTDSSELKCVIKVGKVYGFHIEQPSQKFVAVASETSRPSDKSSS